MSIQTKSLGAKASLPVWGSPGAGPAACNRRVETEGSLYNIPYYTLTKQLHLKITKIQCAFLVECIFADISLKRRYNVFDHDLKLML